MKKSSFVALVLGTVSGILFSLGMCMALIPEWGMLTEGVVCGGIGLVLALITGIVWRRMEHKAPLRFSRRTLGTVVLGIGGALLLGVGMCFCMIWENMVLGIVIGIIGIVALLGLIPLTKGFVE